MTQVQKVNFSDVPIHFGLLRGKAKRDGRELLRQSGHSDRREWRQFALMIVRIKEQGKEKKSSVRKNIQQLRQLDISGAVVLS